MPIDIIGLVWIVGGGLITILLGVIGYFASGWASRHDKRSEEVSSLLGQHDRRISVAETDVKHILSKMDGVADSLKNRQSVEDARFEQNVAAHQQILDRISQNQEEILSSRQQLLLNISEQIQSAVKNVVPNARATKKGR